MRRDEISESFVWAVKRVFLYILMCTKISYRGLWKLDNIDIKFSLSEKNDTFPKQQSFHKRSYSRQNNLLSFQIWTEKIEKTFTQRIDSYKNCSKTELSIFFFFFNSVILRQKMGKHGRGSENAKFISKP